MVVHKLRMDLCGQKTACCLEAMQGDRDSRFLEISLFQGILPWRIPEDALVLIRYERPDGSGGSYDTLGNGEKAWQVRNNCLQLKLAGEVLALSGLVKLNVQFLQHGTVLNTFPLEIRVRKDLTVRENVSAERAGVTGFLPAPETGTVGQFLRVSRVDEKGRVAGLDTANGAGGSGVYVLQEGQSLEDVPEDMVMALDPRGEGTDSGTQTVQADWNAAEGENGHILNRTHYTEKNIQVILPETERTLGEGEIGFLLDQPMTFQEGETYTVNWNGQAYECICRTIEEEGNTAYFLGNYGALTEGDDTGEPFVMMCAGDYRQVLPLDGSTEVTVSIVGPVETVHTIPAKYISGFSKVRIVDIQQNEYVVETFNNTSCYKSGLNYDYFVRQLYGGDTVLLRMWQGNRFIGDLTPVNWICDRESGLVILTLICINGELKPQYIRFADGTWLPPGV